MRKSDKKLDNQLRALLMYVCETALKDTKGFQWLTHSVNYDQFPASLRLTCVFDTDEQLSAYLGSSGKLRLLNLMQDAFKGTPFAIKKLEKHIRYDTEERCAREHQGNWARRLG